MHSLRKGLEYAFAFESPRWTKKNHEERDENWSYYKPSINHALPCILFSIPGLFVSHFYGNTSSHKLWQDKFENMYEAQAAAHERKQRATPVAHSPKSASLAMNCRHTAQQSAMLGSACHLAR